MLEQEIESPKIWVYFLNMFSINVFKTYVFHFEDLSCIEDGFCTFIMFLSKNFLTLKIFTKIEVFPYIENIS